MRRLLRTPAFALQLLLACAGVQLGAASWALPNYQGGGSHGVSGLRSGANSGISVEAQRAFVRWQGFNVDAGETFRINGNPSQTILNLVTGADPSRIAGMVDSGARFILANPNGISVLSG
ncbi:MAG: filamentous hemagglutinin N-terminal domain-containing protein, partial [Vulcanococcus sp.]